MAWIWEWFFYSLFTWESIISTYRFIGLYIKNIIHFKAGKTIIHWSYSRGKIPHQMWIIMSFTSVNRNEKTRSYQLVFLRFCFSLYEMKCRPWECFQTFQFFVQCKIQHKRKSHPMRKKYVFNLTNLFFKLAQRKLFTSTMIHISNSIVTKKIFNFIPLIVRLFKLKYVLNAKLFIYDKTFMAPKTYVCKWRRRFFANIWAIFISREFSILQ